MLLEKVLRGHPPPDTSPRDFSLSASFSGVDEIWDTLFWAPLSRLSASPFASCLIVIFYLHLSSMLIGSARLMTKLHIFISVAGRYGRCRISSSVRGLMSKGPAPPQGSGAVAVGDPVAG